jgi:hypothetical protein
MVDLGQKRWIHFRLFYFIEVHKQILICQAEIISAFMPIPILHKRPKPLQKFQKYSLGLH